MADCIFCKIAGGEIHAAVIFENEHVIVIDDINPVAKVHSLIIPKKHYDDILSVEPDQTGALSGIQQAVREIAAQKGIAASGFRLVTNSGADGGQTVRHLHFHIIGGQSLKNVFV